MALIASLELTRERQTPISSVRLDQNQGECEGVDASPLHKRYGVSPPPDFVPLRYHINSRRVRRQEFSLHSWFWM